MTELPIAPAPGVTFAQSYYAAGKDTSYISEGAAFRQGQARWDNGYNVEFIAGYPQKIAGWTLANNTFKDTPRATLVWRDNAGVARVALATQTHLYSMISGALTDITPLRTLKTGTLTNALNTTNTSTTVTVVDAAAQVQVGDWVFINNGTSVGGLTLNNWFSVVSVSAGVSFTITSPLAATGSITGGGGTISYQYPRVTLGSAPFATTSGSSTVKVTHSAHNAVVGNYVTFSGATAVAGLTISGEYQITTIVDANNYDITASGNASSTTTGGGTAVSVIYPVPIQQVSSTPVAYSVGNYGAGNYSSGNADISPANLNGWTLAAYGDQLLSNPIGGTIYICDPVVGGRSYPMLNAPTSINAMFVTPERFVVAIGVSNAMQIAWCDQNDYSQWTSTAANTAESGRTIVGGSFMVGGIAVKPGVSLLWSDRCVFSMTYTGNQYIYTLQQAGDNCGLASSNAAAVEGGVAYWFSDKDFWSYNGSAAVLPSDDIRTFVFESINATASTRCVAVMNRSKRQVRFYYPSGGATENNAGMIFHYDSNCWSPLNFGRCCGTDAYLLAYPVSADTAGIYYDESGVDANGAALPYFLQMAMTDISNGDKNVDIFGYTPDWTILSGNPSLNILTQYYPDQAITTDGPYTLSSTTTRQDLRSDGKLFAFSISDNEIGCNFRLGLPRVDIAPSGSRR